MATDKNVNFAVTATDKTKKVLSGTQKNLKSTSKEANTLSSRFRNMARATAAIEGPLGGTAGRLSSVATLMGNMNIGVLAITGSFALMTTAVFKSLQAFSEYEVQTFKINQLLQQTGSASGKTAQDIEEMSQRIGFATLESTSGVREASGVLLSFKSIAGDAFERTMVLAADMTAVVGGDLNSAVKQLGKALEDPATGMSALRRSGVSFTDSQKDMIVAMKEAGNVAGAQAEILKLLEGQLGGAGAAQGGGLAGAVDAVGESWTLLMENMAKNGAGDAASGLLNRLARGMQNFNDEFIKPDGINSLPEILDDIARKEGKIQELEKTKGTGVLIERLQREVDVLKQRNNTIMQGVAAEEKKKDAAIEASKRTQKEINDTAVAEKRAADEKAASKGREKELAKFHEFLTKKREADEKAEQDELDSNERKFMNLRMHMIEADADDQKFAEQKRQRDELANANSLSATQGALGDIASLMNSENKKLFKIGKAAAIANAIINTSLAMTKTMTSVPYPFNIPLVALQGVAGLAQVKNIKSQKFSGAKQTGGPVIGGRTYLVGEKGPEAFTAPRSGSIVNNATTNNLGKDGDRTVNLTMVAASDAQMDDWATRNRSLLFNTVLSAMNEEGVSF